MKMIWSRIIGTCTYMLLGLLCFIQISTEYRVHYYSEDEQQCGIRPYEEISHTHQSEDINTYFHSLRRRIVGGDISRQGEWPWLVSIYEDGMVICGGTLVSKNWILTASHCFMTEDNKLNTDPKRYYVVVGEYDVEQWDSSQRRKEINKILTHSQFNLKGEYRNDIALIRLVKPVEINTYRNYACLPKESHLFEDYTECYVAGWGIQNPGGETKIVTTTLKHAAVHIIDKKFCNQVWGEETMSSQICAGMEKQQDACQGDSGGPLMCQKDHRWVVIGIVSYGSGCGTGVPGIYTRVASYTNWIEQHVK